MGRKIAVRLLLLVLLLAALYGQQEIFAREDSQGTHTEREDTDDLEGGGDEDEQTKADTDHSDQEGQEETEQEQPPEGDGDDTQEKPPLPYEVSYGEPDGEEQYYTVKPQVTILHPGETGETVYILENAAGALTEGRISQPGGQAVIEPEAFGEGENRLRVWTEYAPPDEEIQTLYERELIFKIDTCPPSLDMWVEGGEGWHQYQADVGYKVEENSVGSGIKYIAYYVNGQEQERTGQEMGTFTIRQASRGGQGIPVSAVACDQAGNRTYRDMQVYVDDTPPTVEISGVQDYSITSRDVQALFSAADDNGLASCSVQTIRTSPEGEETMLGEGEWNEETGRRQASQVFSQDGIYRLWVRAVDWSGLQSEARAQVIVDKQNPVIAYVDEMDGTWVKEFCWDRPVAEIFTDFTSYTYRLTLDGVPYLPGQTVKKEGRRLLEAEAVDAAGNRSRAAAAFVIDHTPPEILFEGVENGVAYEERRTCTVRLGNSSDRIKEIRINGERQALETDTDEYSCTFEEHQVYSIRVTAVDRAGNEKEEAVMFQVVPKQTLVDRLLSPARQSLGLEEDGFKREEEETREGATGERAGDAVLPAAAAAALLLLIPPCAALVRRIAKKRGV